MVRVAVSIQMHWISVFCIGQYSKLGVSAGMICTYMYIKNNTHIGRTLRTTAILANCADSAGEAEQLWCEEVEELLGL